MKTQKPLLSRTDSLNGQNYDDNIVELLDYLIKAITAGDASYESDSLGWSFNVTDLPYRIPKAKLEREDICKDLQDEADFRNIEGDKMLEEKAIGDGEFVDGEEPEFYSPPSKAIFKGNKFYFIP
jgi:hypothetical protein